MKMRKVMISQEYPGAKLALELRTDILNMYGHVICHPMLLLGNKPQQIPLYETTAGLWLQDGFRIYSQISQGVKADGNLAHSYAWECEYCTSSVRLIDVRRMFKTLNMIDKRMRRLEDREGMAATYGQYINRVMRAIGATMVYEADKISEGVISTSWTLKDAAYIVDSRTADIIDNLSEGT